MTTEAGRRLAAELGVQYRIDLIRAAEAEARDMLAPVVTVTHEEDDSWSVAIAAMPGHIGAAMTIPEAAVEAHDAALAWLEAYADQARDSMLTQQEAEDMAREAHERGFAEGFGEALDDLHGNVAEARAALLAELEAGVEGLDGYDALWEGGDLVSRAAVLDLIRKADDATDVWSDDLPPGGYVCGACGQPTESDPCAEHQPHKAGGK